MDRTELFNEALFAAGRLVEKGAREDALTVLRLLAEDAAFGPVRVIACTNCALVSVQLGRHGDALAWYDRGIGLEVDGESRIASRYKAGLLADLGRTGEALAALRAMLAQPLTADDAAWVRGSIARLEGATP